jgi:hypothetical protein
LAGACLAGACLAGACYLQLRELPCYWSSVAGLVSDARRVLLGLLLIHLNGGRASFFFFPSLFYFLNLNALPFPCPNGFG